MINIVIPMAGAGKKFQEAGYAFPKPLIDIKGRTMIELVVSNLRPKDEHRFIFICQREHYEQYDLHNVLKRVAGSNFEVVQISGTTQGAACTALLSKRFIDNEDELMIANSDQYIEENINDFIKKARRDKHDGCIMTFKSAHPKWSYARVDKKGTVIEVAEKKVISEHATAGVYYYKHGNQFVHGAETMIKKNIRKNVCIFIPF